MAIKLGELEQGQATRQSHSEGFDAIATGPGSTQMNVEKTILKHEKVLDKLNNTMNTAKKGTSWYKVQRNQINNDKKKTNNVLKLSKKMK
jgi:hypothetical protein